MTTRRRLLVFGLLTGWVVLGASVWLLWPRTAITAANASKIQKGMSLAEVEVILGGPARWETSGVTSAEFVSLGRVRGFHWVTDEVAVTVSFDCEECVTHCFVMENEVLIERSNGLLRKLHRLLRL